AVEHRAALLVAALLLDLGLCAALVVALLARGLDDRAEQRVVLDADPRAAVLVLDVVAGDDLAALDLGDHVGERERAVVHAVLADQPLLGGVGERGRQRAVGGGVRRGAAGDLRRERGLVTERRRGGQRRHRRGLHRA